MVFTVITFHHTPSHTITDENLSNACSVNAMLYVMVCYVIDTYYNMWQQTQFVV